MKTAGSSVLRPIGRIGPIMIVAFSLAVASPAGHGAAAPEATPKGPATPASSGALGLNLDYLRVRAVPADLVNAKPAATGALVLDLRFATVSATEGFSVAGWLASRARPNAPVLVLFNAATQPALIDALAPGYLPAGVITLAPAGTSPPADIVVDVSAEADRRAYEAHERGTALTSLVTTTTEKQRFDEAELIRRDAAEAAGKSPAPKTTPPPQPRPGPERTAPAARGRLPPPARRAAAPLASRPRPAEISRRIRGPEDRRVRSSEAPTFRSSDPRPSNSGFAFFASACPFASA